MGFISQEWSKGIGLYCSEPFKLKSFPAVCNSEYKVKASAWLGASVWFVWHRCKCELSCANDRGACSLSIWINGRDLFPLSSWVIWHKGHLQICSWVFNVCWTQYSWLKGDDCDWRNGASTSTYLYFWMLGLCRCRYSRLVADLVSKTWSDSRYVTHVFTPVTLVFVLCCEHFSASWGKDVKRLLAEVVVAESTTLWSAWFRDVNYQTRERCNCRFQMHVILSKVIWEHLSYQFSFSWLTSW